MNTLKNDLLLRVLKGEPVERPPVWMMRQAGRYLPDFRALRAKHTFFERCESPDLVSQITLMPVDQIGVDAAILFSDILVIPRAMGVGVSIEPGIGPVLTPTIRSQSDIERLTTEVEEKLNYVFKGISATQKDLGGRVPLIGFAGAPWTILCYMVEGSGSKTFQKTKTFIYQHPQLAHALLEKITEASTKYLLQKAAHGCDVLQLFDSWGGLLSREDYLHFSLPYIEKILNVLHRQTPDIPTIVFAKGCAHILKDLGDLKPQAIGLDWTCDPKEVRKQIPKTLALQGNLDPSVLMGSETSIRERTRAMLKTFGLGGYIANLGHGILPETPPQHAKVFVDTVKSVRY